MSDDEWLDLLTNLSYIDPVALTKAGSKIPCPILHKRMWKFESSSLLAWMKDFLPKGIEPEQVLIRAQEERIIGHEEKTTLDNKQIRVLAFNKDVLQKRIKELDKND